MKLPFIFLSLLLWSCFSSGRSENKLTESQYRQVQLEAARLNSFPDSKKYLIDNGRLGEFEIGKSWRQIAKEIYQYTFLQGYGACIDACCDGGFLVGEKITQDQYGKTIENAPFTIGAARYDKDVPPPNKSDIFQSISDNCKGWFYSDKVAYIRVYSTQFQTKEGIGVGSPLALLNQKLSDLKIERSADETLLYAKVKEYPKILFILDEADLREHAQSLNFEQFQASAVVQCIEIN